MQIRKAVQGDLPALLEIYNYEVLNGVAIGKDGPLVVEGNRSSSFDIIQVPPKKGARDMLDGLIAEIKAAEKEK